MSDHNESSVEANGIEIKGTPNVVYLKTDRVDVVTRTQLRRMATEHRV